MIMAQVDYAQGVADLIRAGAISYHDLFSLVDELETPEDVESFMIGYVEAMKERIQRKVDCRDRDVDNFFWGGVGQPRLSLDGAAKVLAADNLPFLANIYEANRRREVPDSWDVTVSRVCSAA